MKVKEKEHRLQKRTELRGMVVVLEGGCETSPVLIGELINGAMARTWIKHVPCDCTGDRDTSCLLIQPSVIVKERLENDGGRLHTPCYRRENQYQMHNSPSFITAYHDQFTVPGSAPLFCLICSYGYHVPTCYK